MKSLNDVTVFWAPPGKTRSAVPSVAGAALAPLRSQLLGSLHEPLLPAPVHR